MHNTGSKNAGFSLIELLIGMTITLVLLAVISSIVFRSTSVRARESRKADALISAQAALNVMTREIANSGFGLFSDSTSQTPSNGIVVADSGVNRIRVRSNFDNVGNYSPPTNATVINTNAPGEDITYFFDNTTQSIVRYDPNAQGGPESSVVVNKISNITFEYYNYTSSSSTVTTTSSPTSATGRVRLTVVVQLDPVAGQPDNQSVTFTSDVTLRNSSYMLRQY